MRNALAVGFGGFFGCIARYLAGVLFSRLFDSAGLLYATLVVNVVGCLLIGLLGGLSENARLVSPELGLFLTVGLLGGFTTYSTFGYQTVVLARDGQTWSAALNVSSHLVLGLGAVWLGALAAKRI
ncbi:MAG: fluoride efflux transporter CrcB [Acidobacteria bacterium]|nr:fluoride efflux transporter CrcB [Acidobacteriota bacterium]